MKSLKLIHLSALPRKSNRIFFKEHFLFYRTSLLYLTSVWSHVFLFNKVEYTLQKIYHKYTVTSREETKNIFIRRW